MLFLDFHQIGYWLSGNDDTLLILDFRQIGYWLSGNDDIVLFLDFHQTGYWLGGNDDIVLFLDFHQTGYWLGGNDYIKEGEWRWSETGSPIGDFNQWGAGYPDGNRTHDCMLQVYNGDTSMWIDSNCNHARYYICEHP